MAVPTREEAAQILVSLEPPDWLLAHSAAVADVAAFLAAGIEQRGHAINVGLSETAALLHDVGKAVDPDHKKSEQGHASIGADWLREKGLGELAVVILSHPVTLLADDEHWAVWSREATVEERVMSYSDKRATSDLVPIADRFDRWIRKHGDNEMMRAARERAEILEQQVCAAAGVAPDEVERLRWAEDALATAIGREASEVAEEFGPR
jgi:putative nucleotidyltransferase with HDIG domain